MLTHATCSRQRRWQGPASGIRRRQGGGDRVPALLPHLRAGGDHAGGLSGETCSCSSPVRTRRRSSRRWSATRPPCSSAFHALRYLKDHKDTDKVNLAPSQAGPLRGRHAARIHHQGLDAADRLQHHRGLRAFRDVRDEPRQSGAAAQGGSFGCPVPNVLAAVIDPERSPSSGRPGRRAGAVGTQRDERVLASPEETARAFLERDGRRWLRTGDIVRMDEEGYFTSSTAART